VSPWIVEPCPVGWGVDSAGSDASPGNVLTDAWFQLALSDPRLDWRPTHVRRYLAPSGMVLDRPAPGGDVRGCWSISRMELEAVARSGLHLELIQFPVDWWRTMSADLGERLGVAAVCAREALGLPAGAHLWNNYEGRGARDAGTVNGYRFLDSWSSAVTRSGDRAGQYIGDDSVPLSGRELYRLPRVTSYHGGTSAWRNPAMSPDPRGYAVRQRAPSVLHGLLVDWNEVVTDGRGQTPMGYRWLG
jgi:hypothetical protein